MLSSAAATSQRGVARHHGFHPLRVRRIVEETAEASSIVVDVPAELRDAFAYDAGQFCTFRIAVDGQTHLRCYSMSSSPDVDDDLQVTVKRVPGGVVSNWLLDNLVPGDTIETTSPAGVFCLGPGDRDIVAFSAGSGITPVYSLVKTALATTTRRVRLLYANRDRDAVIFGDAIDALAASHPDRFEVVHHLDAERGFVGPAEVGDVLGGVLDADCYVCGPGPFMDIVEGALLAAGVDPGRIHIERFTPAEREPGPAEASAGGGDGAASETLVTIQLDGRRETTEHRVGTTILQAARQAGLSPPFSCESGSCATCMARLVEGSASMHVNNALTDDEVADGWVLTCQAVPTAPAVHVVYGFEEA